MARESSVSGISVPGIVGVDLHATENEDTETKTAAMATARRRVRMSRDMGGEPRVPNTEVCGRRASGRRSGRSLLQGAGQRDALPTLRNPVPPRRWPPPPELTD